MPQITSCIFENRNWTGSAHCNTGWGWVTWTFDGFHATIARVRRDSEVVIALRPQINTSANRETIDGTLPGDATRTSGLRAGMVNYGVVDHLIGEGRHPKWRTLVDINFDVKVELPWYCAGRDAIATIHYYVHVFLDDDGNIQADVDGWSWHRERGGACAERVDDALDANVPDGMEPLQEELDSALGPVSRLSFSNMFFLPGDGEFGSPEKVSNVRHEAALILIP